MWVFLITCRPSSVYLSVRRLSICPSVCPSVCKLFTFSSSSPEPLSQFQPNLVKGSLGEGDSSLFKWRTRPFPRGDNYELVNIHLRNLKIFFSRTTGPISTKLGAKLPWVKGIQVSSNEEPINSHEVINVFSLNQHYDIIICVYRFELFSQVSDVAHGPLFQFSIFYNHNIW